MTLHAIQRANERYGLTFDGDDIGAILDLCADPTKAIIFRKSDHSVVYITFYAGRQVIPVIAGGKLVTFEPMEILTNPGRYRAGHKPPQKAGERGAKKPQKRRERKISIRDIEDSEDADIY